MVIRNIRFRELKQDSATAGGPGMSLFNGRDLTGWVEGKAGHWTIQDGVLVGAYPPGAGRTASGILTEKAYRDFELTFQVQIGFKRWGAVHDWTKTLAGPVTELAEAARSDEYNQVRIRCQGNRLAVSVNGVAAPEREFDFSELESATGFVLDGTLDAMRVKDVRLVELKPPGQ